MYLIEKRQDDLIPLSKTKEGTFGKLILETGAIHIVYVVIIDGIKRAISLNTAFYFNQQDKEADDYFITPLPDNTTLTVKW